MNERCTAFKQRICINLGFGDFDIFSEISNEIERFCVCCGLLLGKVVRIGFCHCEYIYKECQSNELVETKCGRVKGYEEGQIPNGKNQVSISVFDFHANES